MVTERPDGWYHGSKLVSDVTFIIEDVETDASYVTPAARGRGIRSHQRQTFQFEDDYDRIRRNVARWLEDGVLATGGTGHPP